MKRISLVRLEIEAFKSFREKVAVDMPQEPGFRLLTGDNRQEPRLGANGAGKSSFWDAFFWCCYGVSVRGHRASDLVSWGQKRPLVSVTLDINGEQVVIARQGSPERLAINGQPSTQFEVDALLGLSRQRMQHAVLFGQAVPLFLDLGIAARGALLDEVLDLSIWQRAGDEAGLEERKQQAALTEAKREHAYHSGRLAGLPPDESLAALEQEWASERAKAVESWLQELERAAASVDELTTKHAEAAAALAVSGGEQRDELRRLVDEAQSTLSELAGHAHTLNGQLSRVDRDIRHIQQNPNCPTCKQKFPEREQATALATLRQEREQLLTTLRSTQSDSELAQTWERKRNEARAQLAELERGRDGLVRAEAEARAALAAAKRDMVKAEEQLLKVGEQATNPHSARRREVAAQRAITETALEEAQNAQFAAMGRLESLEFWKKAFKRVRLFMVARILKHLELEVANAASLLGLPGWTISFATETETKSGTMTQGIQVLVRSPSASGAWELWSGGEGQRVRLAVAMGFASMVQRMSGVNYTFEVWDEPSAWLSPEGIEDLLEALKQRSDAHSKAVWLLDHRALTHSGFSAIWSVVKDAQGSRVSAL